MSEMYNWEKDAHDYFEKAGILLKQANYVYRSIGRKTLRGRICLVVNRLYFTGVMLGRCDYCLSEQKTMDQVPHNGVLLDPVTMRRFHIYNHIDHRTVDIGMFRYVVNSLKGARHCADYGTREMAESEEKILYSEKTLADTKLELTIATALKVMRKLVEGDWDASVRGTPVGSTGPTGAIS